MTSKNHFIVLSKNRIARELRLLYKELDRKAPNYILYDFDMLEKRTKTSNQPTARNILTSDTDL